MSRMLYKHPGKHFLHRIKVDYVVVEDDRVEEMVNSGWSYTPAEAKARYEKERDDLLEKIDKNMGLSDEVKKEDAGEPEQKQKKSAKSKKSSKASK